VYNIPKKYKLKCFKCNEIFSYDFEVYRNIKGHPLCFECIYDEIELEFGNDYYSKEEFKIILDDKFKKDFRKMMKDIIDWRVWGYGIFY
jgi:hypothetical protein